MKRKRILSKISIATFIGAMLLGTFSSYISVFAAEKQKTNLSQTEIKQQREVQEETSIILFGDEKAKGLEFTLHLKDDMRESLIHSQVMGDNLQVVFTDLEEGTYYIDVANAPENMAISFDSESITIDENNKHIEVYAQSEDVAQEKTEDENSVTDGIPIAKQDISTFAAGHSVRYYSIPGWTVDTSTGHWGEALKLELFRDGAFQTDVFCLNSLATYPNIGQPMSQITFESLGITDEQRQNLELIANFGYYTQVNPDNYALTQGMIWDYLGQNSRFVSSAYPNRVSQEAWRSEVWRKVNDYKTGVSFHDETHTLNVGDSITLTDTNNVLQNMNIFNITNSNLSATINGSNLIITANGSVDGTAYINLIKPIRNNWGASFVLTQHNGTQEVGVLFTKDPTASRVAINVNSLGNLEVAKKDSKGNYVAGMTFDVYRNADGTDKIGTYTTGADGKATINDLKIGTVYVQEKKVPAGLTINTTLHPVTIEANKTATITLTNERVTGKVTLTKQETDNNIADSDRTLVGAKYGIYAKNSIKDPITGKTLYNPKSLVATQLTNGEAKVVFTNLELGTYYIQEITPSNGYELDTTKHEVVIAYKDDQTKEITRTITSKEAPTTGNIEILKVDAESGETVKKAGTVFEILYKGKVVKTTTTNSDGKATIKDLPAGTYTVREKQAPTGYVLGDTEHTVIIKEHQKTYKVTAKNVPVKGEITLTKEDIETGITPQGDASLKGAEYTLYAHKDIVNPANGEVIHKAGATIATRVVGDGLEVSWNNLYLGEYEVKETKAPTGYLLDTKSYQVTLAYKDQSTPIVKESAKSLETVKKQAFSIIKISTNGDNSLVENVEGAEFTVKLTSEVNAIGWENARTYDVLVTDKNGQDTSIELPYGTYLVKETKTPANMSPAKNFTVVIDEDSREPQAWRVVNNPPFETYLQILKLDMTSNKLITLNNASFSLYDEAGKMVEFKVGHEKITVLNTDDNGYTTTPLKMKAGTYYIHEVTTPLGFLTLEEPVEVVIDAQGAVEVDEDGDPIIKIRIYNEQPVVNIRLTKTFEASSHIEYKEAKFELRNGILPVVSPVDGTIIYKAFEVIPNPDTNDGLYTVKDGETLEINNLPMGTSLLGVRAQYQLKEVSTSEGYVPYEDVIVYNFTMEDETTKSYELGKDIENALLRTDIEITKVDEYTNEIVEDLTNIEFELSYSSEFAEIEQTTKVDEKTGKAKFTNIPYGVTAFIREKSTNGTYYLSEDVYEIVVDKNLEGIGTTYRFAFPNKPIPVIGTTAMDKETASNQGATRDEVTIIDAVHYEKLEIGKEYTVKGILMDKATGEPLLINNKEVTAEKTFKPEANSGSIDLEFTFDGKNIEGKTVVVFEDLYLEEKEVATHSDIEDEGQTVYFPKVRTTAQDKETGSNQGVVREEITIIDTVSYNNLIIGKEYTVKGILMDKETGEPLLIDEKEVTAERTFIAETTSGTIDLEFIFSGKALAGKTVVFFEDLYQNGKEVATHSDIDDQKQTVYYPSLRTKATGLNGEKTFDTSIDNTIIDAIAYKNIDCTKKYTLVTELRYTDTQELVVPSVIQTDVSLDGYEGQYDVNVLIPANTITRNGDVYFSEYLYAEGKEHGKDLPIAVHDDRTDKDQTITFKIPNKVSVTGDAENYTGYLVAMLSAAMGSCMIMKRKKVFTKKG